MIFTCIPIQVQLTDIMKAATLRPTDPSSLPDLFDTSEMWLTHPQKAFDAFLNGPHFSPTHDETLSEASKEVYRAMFAKFLRYLQSKRVEINQVKSSQIKEFLDTSKPKHTKQARYRYVRLLERAYAHFNGLGAGGANPGSLAAQEKVGRGENDMTHFLTVPERNLVIRQVWEVVQSRDQACEDLKAARSVRDAALIGAMLGGGLKVGSVVGLSVNCMVLAEHKIDVPTGYGDTYQATLEPWACEAIAAWLDVRGRLVLPDGPPGIAHAVVFGRLTAVRPSKGKEADALFQSNPATVFRQVDAFLSRRCGIDRARACPQTLRNSYAATLFDREADDDLVFRSMGHATRYATDRLKAAYHLFCNPNGADLLAA
jgi:site-specific recombinase XerD